MVITEKFAWAHLPKAAGDATRSMFASVPGLVTFQAPSESNEKHNGYWVHEREIGDRLRVMNIRRLPSWILSAAHHKAASGLHPDYTPLPMPSVDEMTEDTDPDDLLRWMTGPHLPVQRWLRAENLGEDVEALLRDVGVDPDVARRAIESVPWVGNDYEHDVSQVFGSEQIARMYELNPGWAAAERAAYGNVGPAPGHGATSAEAE